MKTGAAIHQYGKIHDKICISTDNKFIYTCDGGRPGIMKQFSIQEKALIKEYDDLNPYPRYNPCTHIGHLIITPNNEHLLATTSKYIVHINATFLHQHHP